MVDSIIMSFDIWTDAQNVKFKGRVKSIENISFEGIAHLRELILELAVRGMLVTQDLHDEPASKLFLEDKIITFKGSEQPFKLPAGWVWLRNSSLYSLIKGKKPKTLSEQRIGLPYLDIDAL